MFMIHEFFVDIDLNFFLILFTYFFIFLSVKTFQVSSWSRFATDYKSGSSKYNTE